jgi:hypothetical protein
LGSPWHGRREAWRPWRGGVRGGGSIAADFGEGGRKGKMARPGGLARPAGPVQGQMANGPENRNKF